MNEAVERELGRCKVEKALGDLLKRMEYDGFLAKGNHLCCQSCAGAAIYEEAKRAVKEDGLRYRGYCFWHGQDQEGLVEAGQLYLAYGGNDEEESPWQWTPKQVGEYIVKVLTKHPVAVEWDGDVNTRIFVSYKEVK